MARPSRLAMVLDTTYDRNNCAPHIRHRKKGAVVQEVSISLMASSSLGTASSSANKGAQNASQREHFSRVNGLVNNSGNHFL